MEQLPIDLSDLVPGELRLERPEVLPDRDGYSAIIAVLRRMKAMPEKQLTPLTDADEKLPAPGSPQAATLLLSTRELDEAFRQAVSLPFVFPNTTPSQWNDTEHPVETNVMMFEAKRLVRMMLRRASVLVAEDRHAEASSLALDVLHFAHGVKAGCALMIGYMVGAAYEAMATTWLHRYVARAESIEILTSVLDQLPAHSPVDKALVRTYQTEFNEFLLASLETQTLAQLAESADGSMSLDPVEIWPREGARLLDRRKTAEGAALIYKAAVEGLHRPYPYHVDHDELAGLCEGLPVLPETSDEEAPTPDQIAAFRKELAHVDNALGKQLLSQVSLYSLGQLSMKLRTDIEALKARAGVRVYELREGSLPANLESLVSGGILRDMPADPASNGHLKYDRKRRLIWGAGVDARDSGGKTGGHSVWSLQDDLVYEL